MTFIIDGVTAWPLRGDSAQADSQSLEGVIQGLDPDDVSAVEVYKGPSAEAHGACPGTGVILLRTKSGNWKLPKRDLAEGGSERLLTS